MEKNQLLIYFFRELASNLNHVINVMLLLTYFRNKTKDWVLFQNAFLAIRDRALKIFIG